MPTLMPSVGVILSSVLLLSGCDEAKPSLDEKVRVMAEKECQLVRQAVKEVSSRPELAQNEPCKRILTEGCDYQVELQFELLAREMPLMSDKVGQGLAWTNSCDDELGFARAY